jgi:hypothetical protein
MFGGKAALYSSIVWIALLAFMLFPAENEYNSNLFSLPDLVLAVLYVPLLSWSVWLFLMLGQVR